MPATECKNSGTLFPAAPRSRILAGRCSRKSSRIGTSSRRIGFCNPPGSFSTSLVSRSYRLRRVSRFKVAKVLDDHFGVLFRLYATKNRFDTAVRSDDKGAAFSPHVGLALLLLLHPNPVVLDDALCFIADQRKW